MAPSTTLSFVFSVTVLAASLIGQAAGHGTITGVAGANGVQAAGYVSVLRQYHQVNSRLYISFGIIASTPRNGALPKPFEQDTSVIRDKDIASGKTG
jgi:hypothetical protein